MGRMTKTVNGYCQYETMSAIQKCIRRGLEREAMLWCLEMAKTSCNSYKMMLNRLATIAHEDIGLADKATVLFATETIRSLYLTVQKLGWAKEQWRKHGGCMRLGNAVRALARAPKSREGDHFVWITHHQWSTRGPGAIPDFALDHHTLRGKKAGRSVEYFLTVSTQLDKPTEDLYRDEAFALRRSETPPSDDENDIDECEANEDRPHDTLF